MTEENEKILQGSLDYRICKKTALASVILLVGAAVVLILLSFAVHSFRLLLALFPVALFCIPAAVINGIRMRQIRTCCDGLSLCETVLQNPCPYPNGGVTFTALLKDTDGRVFPAETRPIAQTRGLLRPNFSELNGKKVLAAYHEPTKQLFVIRILKE